ncbi:MAG: hypothetical protein PHF00_06830 [Elusimicrobia bacterium]|nr:hypothetical protein [Elusimicrobiota bacterium]
MTVSSHLTPEPERRLWLLLNSVRRARNGLDARTGGLTAFVALQLASLQFLAPGGITGLIALAGLGTALILGVLAYYPFSGVPGSRREAPTPADCFLSPRDLAKYSHNELILRLEKYLGGGVTATPYHEDLVGQIVTSARVVRRKETLFRAACVAAVIGQFGWLGRLIRG